jgi:hypothetical protein
MKKPNPFAWLCFASLAHGTTDVLPALREVVRKRLELFLCEGRKPMAQIVEYMQENVRYEEGPFVVVHLPNNPYLHLGPGYRIEAECKYDNISVLPHSSINSIMQQYGSGGKFREKKYALLMCDLLNRMVHERKIVLRRGNWILR